MKRTLLACLASLFAISGAAFAQDLANIEIPYTKHELDNGLRVIVHEDHTAPTAFVIVYYGVGSRDEVPGKTGFAHLFEHLMFNGTENNDDDHFVAVDGVVPTAVVVGSLV